MAKKTLITGIDIGASSIKVATLSWSEKGKVELKKATRVEVDLPPDPPAEDELRVLKAAALKKAMSDHKVKGGRTVTAIPREDVVIRYITLPSTREEELAEMLEYDIERHVPFATDQMDIGYQVLRKREDQESEIVLAAVPEDRMREHLEILEKAGLEPDLIDVSIFGTCQAYMNGGSLGSVRAVVNIGWRATEIGFFREGVIRFTRSVHIGYQRLHESFREAGLEPEEYPDFNKMAGPSGEVKQEWFDRLVLELSRTLHAFRHETHNPSPDVIILCGGMASARGLPARLSKALGINTEIVNPMLPDKVIPYKPVESLPEPDGDADTEPDDEGGEEEELVAVGVTEVEAESAPAEAGLDEFSLDTFTAAPPEPKKETDQPDTKKGRKEKKADKKKGAKEEASGGAQVISASPVASSPMPEFSTAVGLAMRNTGRLSPLNLLPERIIQQRETARSRRFARSTAVLVFLILLVGSGLVGLEFYNRIDYRSRLETAIAGINPDIADIQEAQQELARISQYQDKEHSFYRILHDIYLATPEGTQFTKVQFQKQKQLRLSGTVFTTEDAEQLVRILREINGPDGKPMFSAVELPTVSRVDPRVDTISPMKVAEFEIEAEINSADQRRRRSR